MQHSLSSMAFASCSIILVRNDQIDANGAMTDVMVRSEYDHFHCEH